MKKNKYEDITILDFDDKIEDLLEIFSDRCFCSTRTVSIIANREIVEYITDTILKYDWTSVLEIDFVNYEGINEYLVSVDRDGYVTAVPIEDFIILEDTDIVYIDMDGDIPQKIIDYCVNEDKEVILFGDRDNNCDENCETCSNLNKDYVNVYNDSDDKTHGFTASKVDDNSYVSYSFYSSDELSDKDIQKMLKFFGI